MGDKPECGEVAKKLERIADALERIADALEQLLVDIPLSEFGDEWDVTA